MRQEVPPEQTGPLLLIHPQYRADIDALRALAVPARVKEEFKIEAAKQMTERRYPLTEVSARLEEC